MIDSTESRDEISPGGAEFPALLPRPHQRRIPNLGDTLLLVAFAAVLVLLFGLSVTIVGGLKPSPGIGAATHPVLLILAQTAAYLGTLAAAWLFFPMVWKRPFLDGIHWRWTAANRRAGRLILLGLMMAGAAAAATFFIKTPKTLPLDKFFSTPMDAWFLTVFGIFVAPAFEEICYRGFLLPAFAIAYDWLALPRTQDARELWETTAGISRNGMIFSTILGSALFAMMHFEQDAHIWAVMLVLFCVSLALTIVRVKMESVAASTIVHAAYNSFQLLAVAWVSGGFRHLDRIH